ncbi:MAG: carbohydrate ABC transporter permease, partial [Acetanaerobacterium sp.]
MDIRKLLWLLGKIFIGVLLILVFFVPFYWMIITSVKSLGQVLEFPPPFWVADPQWQNFAKAFTAIPFLKYTLNSIIVTVGILACQMVTVIPAAYAFAKYSFAGKKFFFGLT